MSKNKITVPEFADRVLGHKYKFMLLISLMHINLVMFVYYQGSSLFYKQIQ